MCKHIALVLPNRPGHLNDVAEALSAAEVNILGYSISVQPQGRGGILQLLCTPHEVAFRTLQTRYSFYCSEKEVVVAEADHEAGGLQKILSILASRDINIPSSYMAFSTDRRALVVLEFDSPRDTQNAISLLASSQVLVLSTAPA